MATPGPPPKDDAARVRRNAPAHDEQEVSFDGVIRGPKLPTDIGINWCPRTMEWWEVWRNSPQSMVMTATDWEQMLETALIHQALWEPNIVWLKDGTFRQESKSASELKTLASELRSRVAAFGSTYEDRMKLRMSITQPQDSANMDNLVKKEARKGVDYLEMMNQEIAKTQNK